MFRVDWSAVATDALLDEVRAAAGTAGDPENSALRPVVATVLSHCGGLPVTDADWDDRHRTEVGRRLLHEALTSTLTLAYGTPPLPGFALEEPSAPLADLGLEALLRAVIRTDVNAASPGDLEPLPVFGPVLSSRTLAERRARGPFRSLRDLADRVPGLGRDSAAEISPLIRFGGTPTDLGARGLTGSFPHDLRLAIRHWGSGEGPLRLTTTLERLATAVADRPHPATRAGRVREELSPARPPSDGTFAQASRVELLEDEGYDDRVHALLSGAEERIDVAMFFIATSDAQHPAGKLLEALAEVHRRTGAVRVLVDHDREDDPYGSRLINAGALEFLAEHGVPARQDRPENLLHSKFVAIDRKVAVVGSHNWTRASFERYGDVSLAIASTELCGQLHERFDALWNDAPDP